MQDLNELYTQALNAVTEQKEFIKESKEKIQEMERTIETLKEENKKGKEAYQYLMYETSVIFQYYRWFRDNFEVLSAKNPDKDYSDKMEERLDVIEENLILEREKKALLEKVDELEEKLQTSNEEIEDLRNENSHFESQVEKFKDDITLLEEQLKDSKEEIEDLKKKKFKSNT